MGFERKINEGYKDLYYSFSIDNRNDIKKICDKLKKVNFCITQINGNELRIKDKYDEFQNYLSSLLANSIDIEEMKREITEAVPNADRCKLNISIYDKEINTKINGNCLNKDITNDISINLVVFDDKFRVEIDPWHNVFINRKFNEMVVIMNEVEKYTGKSLVGLLYLFMLQPIKIYTSASKVDYINIFLWLYSNGTIIVQYTVPIIDSTVSNFAKPEENPFNVDASLPRYIQDKKYKDQYIYSDSKMSYIDAIKMYNSHIVKLLKIKKIKSTSYLEALYLIDYEKMPKSFSKNVNKDLMKDFFWIVNAPFGYINQVEDSEYEKFFNNRYNRNKFLSFFASTNHRILIALNDNGKNEFCNLLGENSSYLSLHIYMLISIHIIILKKACCSYIINEPYNESYSMGSIIEKQKKLIFMKDYIYYILGNAYGSVVEVTNYLERSMRDYLPINIVDEKISIYKEVTELNSNEKESKKNYRMSFLAVLLTIFLGLEAIEKITIILDEIFKANVSQYNIIIWGIIILTSILIFYLEEIKRLFKFITNKTYYSFKVLKYIFRNIIIYNLEKYCSKKEK